jgi:hypothetical protein
LNREGCGGQWQTGGENEDGGWGQARIFFSHEGTKKRQFFATREHERNTKDLAEGWRKERERRAGELKEVAILSEKLRVSWSRRSEKN